MKKHKKYRRWQRQWQARIRVNWEWRHGVLREDPLTVSLWGRLLHKAAMKPQFWRFKHGTP
ncbi:hypothetical protein LCGC14_1679250 [marine sediment metagenome]|uniref:Uncharacterized protein n=1 Tax=marine sediment metagenome TaxID=412755 RepID=A0A0F9KP53_9ZZZZ